MPTAAKCCQIIFCPIVLLYHSIRIYVCGCLGALLASCGHCIQRACCACWAVLCCCCGCCSPHFVDSEFPPDAHSDGQGHSFWRRIDDVIEEGGLKPALFSAGKGADDNIDPNDVSQGSLGDCWLMSVLAALAQYPETIRNLFQTKRYSPYGKYTLKLYDGFKKQWEYVVVDSFVPCHTNGRKRPKYAALTGNEMWPLLAEKAVAKFCGSYKGIVGGRTEWALATLTGYFTFVLSGGPGGHTWTRRDLSFGGGKNRRQLGHRPNDEGKSHSVEDLFYILREYCAERSIMACSTMPGKDTDTNAQGIVYGHAYTLQRAERVDDHLLVQIRNPWGSGEWTGPWGDKSNMWERYPAVKKKLGHTAADDGSFWMSIQDFVRNYKDVTICVRPTGFNELEIDVHEECGVCGPVCGCIGGCICFWCGCKGTKALCCGEDASKETREGVRPNCCGCY